MPQFEVGDVVVWDPMASRNDRKLWSELYGNPPFIVIDCQDKEDMEVKLSNLDGAIVLGHAKGKDNWFRASAFSRDDFRTAVHKRRRSFSCP